MNREEVRTHMTDALAAAQQGDLEATVRVLEATLQVLNEDDDLMTTTQAAHALGIGSINTVKSWVRTGYLQGVRRGNRVLIPRVEIERIMTSDRAQRLRAAARLHDLSADLGRALTQEELDALDAGRPGCLPWTYERDASANGARHDPRRS